MATMTEQETTRTNGDGDATGARRAGSDPLMQVRAADIEPYTGLGYLSKLFRLIAIFLVALLLLEVGTGLYREGSAALPTLLSEASRLVVLAGLLWGVGDLANLLIDVGHDVRAARILLGRQAAHGSGERTIERDRPVDHPPERPVDRGVMAADRPVDRPADRPADRAVDRTTDDRDEPLA